MRKKELSLEVGGKTVIIRVGDYIYDHFSEPGWRGGAPGWRRGRNMIKSIFGNMVVLSRWPFPLTFKAMVLCLQDGRFTIEEDLNIDVGDIITNRSTGNSFTVKSVCEDGDYYIKKNGSGGIPVLWRKNMARHAVKNNKITIKKKEELDK
jgi:hypothetical protein